MCKHITFPISSALSQASLSANAFWSCENTSFSSPQSPKCHKVWNFACFSVSFGFHISKFWCVCEFKSNYSHAIFSFFQGAAVAYVADLLSVPVIFIKAVTDIVDGEKPTAEEFLQNLIVVTAALDHAVTKVIDFVSGKSLSDLWDAVISYQSRILYPHHSSILLPWSGIIIIYAHYYSRLYFYPF